MSLRRIPPSRIADGLAVDQGLSTAQILTQRVHGFNDIVADAGSGWRELAGETARDPMLWFLVGTAGLFAEVGETSEAITLLEALVPLASLALSMRLRRTSGSYARPGRPG